MGPGSKKFESQIQIQTPKEHNKNQNCLRPVSLLEIKKKKHLLEPNNQSVLKKKKTYNEASGI